VNSFTDWTSAARPVDPGSSRSRTRGACAIVCPSTIRAECRIELAACAHDRHLRAASACFRRGAHVVAAGCWLFIEDDARTHKRARPVRGVVAISMRYNCAIWPLPWLKLSGLKW